MKDTIDYQNSFKISVIIPTYNRGYCISRALDSVEKQTLAAYEILVVDDGSTDNTRDIVNRQYPRARVILGSENRGVSHARNRGINNAIGSHLAFLDSDDCWVSTKLQKQIDHFIDNPNLKINHCNEVWIKNGENFNQKDYHKKSGGDLFDHSLARCMISPSAVMMTKSLLDDYGGFDEHLPACEDYDLWLRITSNETIGFIDEALVTKYGGHSDQLSKTIPVLDRYRIYALKKLIAKGELKPAQLKNTINVLNSKLTIVINGARRRGHMEDVLLYESIRAELIT